MIYLYLGTGAALLVSLFFSRDKTKRALFIAYKKFSAIVPAFVVMLIIISVVLFLLPDKAISGYLGGSSRFLSIFIASVLGSVTLIPGPIAYPLCGILVEKGVLYAVVAAFSTTLMMVGIMTFPVEKEYFGTKVTIIRNLISFFIALLVAVAVGIIFGEFV